MRKLLFLLTLLSLVNFANAQELRKNEFGTFAGVYSSGDLSDTFTYGQQYTRWFSQNIGIGVGTFRSNQEIIPSNASLTAQATTKQESHRYWDVSLRGKINLQKHSFGAVAGISTDKFYQTSFEIKQRNNTSKSEYLTANAAVSIYPAGHVELNYAYQFSPAISAGIFAKKYIGDNPATLYGLKLAYHFNVNKDSLGILPDGERSVGLLAGGSLSNDLQNGETGYRVLLPYAGIYFERQLSLAWKSRLEVTYARRGASSRRLEAGDITYLETRFRGDFLQIPLLFENEFAYQWNLFFGPHASILLNGEKSVSGVKIIDNKKLTTSLGLTAGVSRQLNDKLSIECRYVIDFLNFSENPYATALNDFRLGLRYKLR